MAREPMAREKVATRLHVEETLVAGQVVGLDHGRAHFLRTVLRLQVGAQVALFNGRDGEWSAELEGLGKGWASLVVGQQRRPQAAEADLWLVFAPIKRGRIDFLIEKATELGCSELHPALTRFTAVDRVNTDRLAANAKEAAEQCERLSVPTVAPPRDLGKMIDAWPEERHLLICAERGEAVPIGEALAEASEAGARHSSLGRPDRTGRRLRRARVDGSHAPAPGALRRTGSTHSARRHGRCGCSDLLAGVARRLA